MRKNIIAVLGIAFGLLALPAVPTPAQAVTINITIGSSINHGRSISCSQGARILRNRGFRDVRSIDCRGRHFVYRAWRGNQRFQITIDLRTGRVTDVRRIRR